MHKRSINELRMKLDIIPSGPILIATGDEGDTQTNTDNEMHPKKFVTTYRNNVETVYIPGSSLKGVIRSYCEKVARTIGIQCCNPLLNSKGDENKPDCSCGRKVEIRKNEGNIPVPEIYKNLNLSCWLCKLFGSTGIGSRFFIEDAYPSQNAQKDRYRINVAIDRVSGSVENPFKMEVVERKTFSTEIHIHNFELWQIGLLGLAIRDLHRERIRIGFAKSRGLGKVKGNIKELTITYPFYKPTIDNKKMRSLSNGTEKTLTEDGKFHIYGVGSLMGDDREAYGYRLDDSAIIPDTKIPKVKGDWVSTQLILDGSNSYENQIEPLLKECFEKHFLVTCLGN